MDGLALHAPQLDRTRANTWPELNDRIDRETRARLEKISMYLSGSHVAKDDPAMQMEAHHFCNQVNEEFAQYVLFDGNTAEASPTTAMPWRSRCPYSV